MSLQSQKAVSRSWVLVLMVRVAMGHLRGLGSCISSASMSALAGVTQRRTTAGTASSRLASCLQKALIADVPVPQVHEPLQVADQPLIHGHAPILLERHGLLV